MTNSKSKYFKIKRNESKNLKLKTDTNNLQKVEENKDNRDYDTSYNRLDQLYKGS